MRDRMAGPETGLFFLHNAQHRALAYEGGGLLDGPSLFSVNGRCIRLPLPGTSDTQRLIYATIRSTAQRRFTDNDCTHCISCLQMAGSRHPNAGRAQSAPSAPETGFQCTDARMTYLHTRLNDFTNDDETDDCTHRMRDRALPSGGWGATPRRISESAPFGPETGSQGIGARRTHLYTRLNDLTNDDETDDCTHRMRDRALPSGGRGATPRRISESAPFGPATGSQRIGARRTHLLTCLYIAALTLNEATDKKCGLKLMFTIYTVVNAEGRLVL